MVAPSVVPAEGTEAEIDDVGQWPPGDPMTPDLVEATTLALRLLHEESWWRTRLLEESPYNGLLPDEECLAALSVELAEVLARLRETHPEFARFRVRPQTEFGVLRVRFTDEFAAVVREVGKAAENVRGDRSEAFRTGHAEFDELNEKLGLRHIDVPPEGWDSFLLHLHEHVNTDAASKVYLVLDVVESADPRKRIIDGSDIDADPTLDGWWIYVHNRWGACPSGCTTKEMFRFRAEGDTIERVPLEFEPEYPSRPHYMRDRP